MGLSPPCVPELPVLPIPTSLPLVLTWECLVRDSVWAARVPRAPGGGGGCWTSGVNDGVPRVSGTSAGSCPHSHPLPRCSCPTGLNSSVRQAHVAAIPVRRGHGWRGVKWGSLIDEGGERREAQAALGEGEGVWGGGGGTGLNTMCPLVPGDWAVEATGHQHHRMAGGGGVLARSHGLVFSSAAGGAHWQIAIRCPSLPFPSVKVHQGAGAGAGGEVCHKSGLGTAWYSRCPVPRLCDDLLWLIGVVCGGGGVRRGGSCVGGEWKGCRTAHNCSVTAPVAPTALRALAEASPPPPQSRAVWRGASHRIGCGTA